jgi:non-specific protein-tyrosine kinase
MELRQYMSVVWKWLWLILLGTTVATGLSYYTSRTMPRIYQASTTVMVGQSLRSTNPSTQDLWTSGQLAQTYAEMVRRQPVLQGVVDTVGLGLPWQRLRGQVNVNLIQNTQLMEIKVMDTDPLRAKLIADELARQLILQSPTQPEKQQEQYRQFVEGQIQDLQGKIQTTQEEMQQLQKAIDAETSARELANKQAQMAALQNKLNTYQTNLAPLLNFFQGSTTNYISVVEPATVPTVPVSPKTELNVLLAATVGLILAVGAAFLLEYLDDTIKTADDVEKVLSLSTLGAISRIEDIKELSDSLVTAAHPKAPISEAYRVLRTGLQFSSLSNPVATLLITSAGSLEGKTTTLANLGIVMAQAGKRVILVDTDLRRPVLHKMFGLSNSVGLTTALLEEQQDITASLQETEVDGLRVLTSGPIPPNPSELLGLKRMADIIQRLKEMADIILFDSPPVLAVADASVLANKVGGVLLVVDAGRTRSEVCRRGKEILDQVGGRILGVALNRISPRGGGYYYYYYYYSQEGEGKRHKRKSSRSPLASLPVLGSVIKRFRD